MVMAKLGETRRGKEGREKERIGQTPREGSEQRRRKGVENEGEGNFL